MRGRRLNGKQKDNRFRRITGKQMPKSGQLPAERVAQIIKDVKDKAKQQIDAISTLSGQILQKMDAEHHAKQMILSNAANQH